ncbi:MAG: bile acid:sodium symporter [Myxococcales bacterium]|nr:bile acid:sodium symporter [Myxococcales bacterium]MDH3484867.1 bile acid:sodium symporter [Myxococcales bacterium]
MSVDALIRPLTVITVFGLVLGVGLRVNFSEIVAATRNPGMVARSLLANFVIAPLAILGIALVFELPTDVSIGMMLMAAAPFAPMAPAFVGIGKGDVRVAAGHMVIYCVLAVFLTPPLCRLLFTMLPGAGEVEFDVAAIILSLVITVFAPLAIGLAIHEFAPKVAARLLRPVNVSSLVILVVAVVLILSDQYEELSALGVIVFSAMILSTEIPLAVGYALGGPGTDTRRAIGMGTGVRNLGIGLLIATDSFAGTPVVLAVLAYSLVLILLGLAHAAYWSRRAP